MPTTPFRIPNGCSTPIALAASDGSRGRYYFAPFFAFFEVDFLTARSGCGGVASIRRTVGSRSTLGWDLSLVLGEGLGMKLTINHRTFCRENHAQARRAALLPSPALLRARMPHPNRCSH